MNFSFFANGCNKASSTKIRAVQIADYMNSHGGKARVNPTSNFKNDICIHVKGSSYNGGRNVYFDVVDSPPPYPANKSIPLLAVTERTKDWLIEEHKRTDVRIVRQHHCNFERERREDKEVTTVGFIGTLGSFCCPFEDFEKILADRGLKMLWSLRQRSRKDVVDFYRQIDIQVSYRPFLQDSILNWVKNSLRMFNAGSFGIPTVAFPDSCYLYDFADCFVHANTIEEMADRCLELKEDSRFYKEIADKALLESEKYHIENTINDYYSLERR